LRRSLPGSLDLGRPLEHVPHHNLVGLSTRPRTCTCATSKRNLRVCDEGKTTWKGGDPKGKAMDLEGMRNVASEVLQGAWVGMGGGKGLAIGLWALLVGYVVYEQLWLQTMKVRSGRVEGPLGTLPLLGCVLAMVKDPFGFWETQRVFAMAEFPNEKVKAKASWNSILGKYMLFTTDTDVTRKVLTHNSPNDFMMVVHPSGKHILGDDNLAFMHGPEHKNLRRSFLALFTQAALAKYVTIQDKVVRKHLAQWFDEHEGEELEIRDLIRDMNTDTSQEVFVGPYLTEETKQQFSAAFKDMTDGFLALPICLPGFAVYKGKQGRFKVLRILEKCARESKEAMKAGKEPRCLMDFWSCKVLEEMKEAEDEGLPAPKHSTDEKMASVMMDFLFASQDASTASLTWVMALMADHPEVMQQVIEEQKAVRGDVNIPVSGDLLPSMRYTRQVVLEVLRYRPPATMVPNTAERDIVLADGLVAPKGTLVMPSILASNMQGFTDPLKFDPDRMSPERKEDIKFQSNFLTFGVGAHMCVGRLYAINHLMTFLSIMSLSCTWARRTTQDSDKLMYLPTIYPGDCLVTMQRVQ